MRQNQFVALIKKTNFILSIIVMAFFLRGVFLTTIFPIFTGQDESRHYNAIQYLNEPREKKWDTITSVGEKEKNRLDTYNYSEEIKNTILSADTNEIRDEEFGKINFNQDYIGKNEKQIDAMTWRPINFYKPVDGKNLNGLFHKTSSLIEKTLSNKNILVKFFSIRLFCVFMGTLAILIFYFIFKNVGFSKKISLLLTAIISFQPRFSIYYTNINYDIFLIFFFSLFTLAGILILKNKLNWKNLTLLIISAVLAYLTKGTGIILLAFIPFFLAYLAYEKYKNKINIKKKTVVFVFGLIAIISLFILSPYLPFNGKNPFQIIASLFDYTLESLTIGRFMQSAEAYWGAIGWTKSWIVKSLVYIIWIIEIISAIGIFFFLFSKRKKPDFLPDKKYVVFFIAMIVALQLGIRFADWQIYDEYKKLLLGAPGRYFLPNIASHMALVFIGLGMLVKEKKYFRQILNLSLILMFSYCLYVIFDIVIYRYYL